MDSRSCAASFLDEATAKVDPFCQMTPQRTLRAGSVSRFFTVPVFFDKARAGLSVEFLWALQGKVLLRAFACGIIC